MLSGDSMSDFIMNDNNVIIIVSTNIEDDDISAIIDNLEFRNKIFLITDNDTTADTSGMMHVVDKFKDLDITIRNIQSVLKDAGKIAVGIIGLDEEHHYRISLAIAESLSIKYYDRRVLDIASNKYLQKKVFSEKNIRIPKYFLLEINNPIPIRELDNIGFPNVLKPITGYGSYSVYINDDMDMLGKNISSIKDSVNDINNSDSIVFNHHKFVDANGKESFIDPGQFFIIEEYVGGDEYSCDFIINEGLVDILRVVKKIPGIGIGEFNGFILFNPDNNKISGFDINMLKSECTKIALALGIKEGVCMVDFKHYDDEIIIIESTVRPGIATFVELMGLLYNYTSINMLIRQKLGCYTNEKIPNIIGASVFIVGKSLGTIKNFDTDKLSDGANFSVLNICKYYDTGDIISDYDYESGVKLMGYVLLKVLSEDCLDSLFYDINTSSILRIE